MGSRVGHDVSEKRKISNLEKKEHKIYDILMERQCGGQIETRKCAVCSEVAGTLRQQR
jgi:hypothetical protein